MTTTTWNIIHTIVIVLSLLLLHLEWIVPAAVVNPLLHDGVIRVQVDRDVLVLRVEHVAELLQPAVLGAAASGVP